MSAVRLGHLTWKEAAQAAAARTMVIVPTGATEAHGPHLPLDTDAHQVTYVAERLAERVAALVAPTVNYGYSETWMGFAGTMSLSQDVYQSMLTEICGSLLRHGFHDVMLLNGHRPQGTSNDAVARRVVDLYGTGRDFRITAVSYWEPGAARVHGMRKSPVGGMGHACELETSFQLATRPELVHMERLEGVRAPLVGWDLVAPMEPSRTYESWPTSAENHPAIFGAPSHASAESGRAFLAAIIDSLVELVEHVRRGASAYGERK
ncbi:MAG TPA: creatininase family protein [Candidatus Dormibacteraeota bacterium]|nr:creatininase family protein [Candidatus Dormibacteraeota bacterium]